MKRSALILLAGSFLIAGAAFPDAGWCKKGGTGKGGGLSEDGIFYHSHSDRSYSGKENPKGQGKGHFKEKRKDKAGKGKGAGSKKWN